MTELLADNFPAWTEKPGVAFTLECVYCDACLDLPHGLMGQARTRGWKDVYYDNGPSWNYLGLCPEHGHLEV